jgi:polygalacturonase
MTDSPSFHLAVHRILAALKPPVFPDRDFSVTDFGAVDGGDISLPLHAAILACHTAGGGRVLVPAGSYVSGPIHLRSHVCLHLDSGATISFVPDPRRYLPVVRAYYEGNECLNYSPFLYACGAEQIGLTGEGTLHGNGSDPCWARDLEDLNIRQRDDYRLRDMGERRVPLAERRFGGGHGLRPNMIQFIECRQVLIEGVTLIDSPMWMLHPVLCEHVVVSGVTIRNSAKNGDGFDPESCRYVWARDCRFATCDDGIAVKSGRNVEGRDRNTPTADMVVERCVFDAAPVPEHARNGFAVGSEVSGGVRRLYVRDCEVHSRLRGIFIKSNTERGGCLEDLHFRNIQIDDPVERGMESALVVGMDYGLGEGEGRPDGEHPPVFRSFSFEGIHGRGAQTALVLQGVERSRLRDIRISDCRFEDIRGEKAVLRHLDEAVFEHISVNGQPWPGEETHFHTQSTQIATV